MKRETLEEAGITIKNTEEVGIIEFEFSLENNRGKQEKPEHLEVHIFRAKSFSGTPSETEEMKPHWFNEDEIPFKEMWPDDIYWVPLFLAGKKFKGRFLFGPKDSVLAHEMSVVENL